MSPAEVIPIRAQRVIDLNADLGETVNGRPTADDEAMFALVSSANVAAGGHAGDLESIHEAARRAERFGVVIGAHPSYPDPDNFGRVPMRIDTDDLYDSLLEQLGRLLWARAPLRYVKPHGALYNVIVHDPAHAAAVVAAVQAVRNANGGQPAGLLVLGGEVERQARAAGLRVVREAFLDRGYRADGTLVARGEKGALLHDPTLVAERAVRIATEGVVDTVDGELIPIDAASLCVHGDTPAAVEMARSVRDALTAAHVEIRSPW